MNFKQLRIICEAKKENFNLSRVSEALFTSQPGISKSIIELENEIGGEIFHRNGKKIMGFTNLGENIYKDAQKILIIEQNILDSVSNINEVDHGELVVATTHSQARYMLPAIIQEFRKDYPKVNLEILQCSPYEITQLLLDRKANIGIATEALDKAHLQKENLVEVISFFKWHHAIVVPKAHPLLKINKLKMSDVSNYPIITYSSGITGRKVIDDAFKKENLVPHIVLTALDADVIKTYVELGLGVGIMASIAFDKKRDIGLRMISCDHLFKANLTRIAILKEANTKKFVKRFLDLCLG